MGWQLQDAEQRFSELVRRALNEGPQVVTRHGEEVVVVVPVEQYRRQQRPDFAEFLLAAPDFAQLELDRSGRPPRDAELPG